MFYLLGARSRLAMGAPAQSPEDEKAKIEYELRGKTLKVYLYVLKQGKPVGVREVQRELGFFEVFGANESSHPSQLS